MNNYRKIILDTIIDDFARDERYFLLAGDMGFGAIDKLKTHFPNRIINSGIMEQATVGIAAGMSMAGMVPIVYSIVNFLAFRAIEQIRNDVVLQNLNVKFIATGVNDYFQKLGPSHCCGQNDLEIMNLIGLKTYNPYEPNTDFTALVKKWINDDKSGYLRV